MLKFERSDLNEIAPPMEKRPNRTFYAQIMEGIVWAIAGDLWPGWKDSLQIDVFYQSSLTFEDVYRNYWLWRWRIPVWAIASRKLELWRREILIVVTNSFERFYGKCYFADAKELKITKKRSERWGENVLLWKCLNMEKENSGGKPVDLKFLFLGKLFRRPQSKKIRTFRNHKTWAKKSCKKLEKEILVVNLSIWNYFIWEKPFRRQNQELFEKRWKINFEFWRISYSR